jgi:hypothetical protein
MTVSQAISKADELRPNPVSTSTKVDYLNEINAQLSESMGVDMPDKLTQASTTELLMPYPYDQVYVFYLTAMIDNALEEFALFNNDMALYNQAVHEALAWWRRHHKKPSINAIRGVYH